MLGRKFLNTLAKCTDPAVLRTMNKVDRPVGAGAAALFDDVLGDGHHGSDPHSARDQHNSSVAALVKNELAARHQCVETKAGLRIGVHEPRDKRSSLTAPD